MNTPSDFFRGRGQRVREGRKKMGGGNFVARKLNFGGKAACLLRSSEREKNTSAVLHEEESVRLFTKGRCAGSQKRFTKGKKKRRMLSNRQVTKGSCLHKEWGKKGKHFIGKKILWGATQRKSGLTNQGPTKSCNLRGDQKVKKGEKKGGVIPHFSLKATLGKGDGLVKGKQEDSNATKKPGREKKDRCRGGKTCQSGEKALILILRGKRQETMDRRDGLDCLEKKWAP